MQYLEMKSMELKEVGDVNDFISPFVERDFNDEVMPPSLNRKEFHNYMVCRHGVLVDQTYTQECIDSYSNQMTLMLFEETFVKTIILDPILSNILEELQTSNVSEEDDSNKFYIIDFKAIPRQCESRSSLTPEKSRLN